MKIKSEFDFSDNQEALDTLRLIKYTNESVFLTGKAGTGKSTLLKTILQNIDKNFIVLAPTGVAALNVNGQTINSFFRFGFEPFLPENNDYKILETKKELLENLELIIIDEISMVRSDLMTAINKSLQKNLNSSLPFAGKQLLLIGDLYQLPPIVKEPETREIINTNYSSRYFFGSTPFENKFSYHIIELNNVYRQKDKPFLDLLNGVRENILTEDHLELLKLKYEQTELNKGDFEIMLATKKQIVNNFNTNKLSQINEIEYTYNAIETGSFIHEKKEDSLPAPRNLILKKGAKVMFLKNDRERRWVNGSLGKIESLDIDIIKVKLNNTNSVYNIPKVEWENYEYKWDREKQRVDKTVSGTFSQYPLKLSWAATINKSQGLTFDRIAIDLGFGAFESGQTYVALSRCRTFEGITLISKVRTTDIKVDNKVKEFFASKDKSSMELERYKCLIKGMQDTIDILESENEALIYKTNQLSNQLKKSEEIQLIQKRNLGLFESQAISLKKNNSFLVIFLIMCIIVLLFALFN
jgi:ATP-dependent exoDNAse (exonuclease V) alpha subunit